MTCRHGGKEVHAADVAKAAGLLLKSAGITGEASHQVDPRHIGGALEGWAT